MKERIAYSVINIAFNLPVLIVFMFFATVLPENSIVDFYFGLFLCFLNLVKNTSNFRQN